MKTKEELSALKSEVETLNKKLAELSNEELKQVIGGETRTATMPCGLVLEWAKFCNQRIENDPTVPCNHCPGAWT